jgi:hypothetical protein
MHDRAGDFSCEGELAKLIIHDLWTDAAARERGHSSHKVVAVADQPPGPQQVVRGERSEQCVAGCFSLPINTER